MNYYTLQIHYNVPKSDTWPNGKAIEERKDLTSDIPQELHWMRNIREKIFTTGIQIMTAPGCYEFISPYRINTVYLIKQPEKYSR